VGDEVRTGLASMLPRLRRFAIALTGSVVDGDELVQGTCERVLRKSDQLRDHARVDAWIYGIMRNLWIDELRSRRIRRHEDVSTAVDIIGEDGVATVEGRITLSTVRQALGTLSADQRAVLILVCVDGLSYKEASEVLAIPIGTVMSRLSRGRLELHARLAGPGGGVNFDANSDSNRVTPFPQRRGGHRD
jgi:RNA polymerase sigma-70 factor (ECF subfamily)